MRAHAILLLACTALLPCPALAQDQGYDSVLITAPVPETTIHDNNGNLDIDVSISPPLNEKKGDYVVILFDDKIVASGIYPHFSLTGIERGAHTLVAEVHAADGRVLATSPPVTFYMWQASRLFNNPNRMK